MSGDQAGLLSPLSWKRGSLFILDQRILPRKTRYIKCRSAKDVFTAIRDMAVRGAPAIGVAAAYGMALSARESLADIEKAASLLKKARPTAVNLRCAVDLMLAEARRNDGENLPRRLLRAAEDFRKQDREAGLRMSRLGAGLLRKGSKVLTYCNAGSLATAGPGTSIGVIRQAHEDGKISHAWACETRPYLQGSRLTILELMRSRIPCTLITDNAAAHLMKTVGIDAVVVGSDRIAANADVCNKIGTYALAILARHHRVPFYVIAPTTTIDWSCRSGKDIPIEERDPEEVLCFNGVPLAPRGARARHFAFDVTPHELIAAIVTEKGVVRSPEARKLREAFFK